MIIKQNGFTIPPLKKRPKILVLTGNDPFLMDYFKHALKKSWSIDPEQTSTYRFDIPKPNTFDDALNASLYRDIFATHTIIDIHYDKNQLDKNGKSFVASCLEKNNPDCTIIFQAPLLSDKKLAFLANHPDTILLHIKAPFPNIVERWVSDQLKQAGFRISLQACKLIVQYTQSNSLATAQVIEKIKLCFKPDKTLDESDIKPLLADQAIYQLYELRDACLMGDFDKALSILNHVLENREEPILILWTLTQEMRQLIQLHEYQAQEGNTLQAAFNHLKIWRMQEPLYRKALSRVNRAALLAMLEQALQLDTTIKTFHTGRLRIEFERLIAAFCQGQ